MGAWGFGGIGGRMFTDYTGLGVQPGPHWGMQSWGGHSLGCTSLGVHLGRRLLSCTGVGVQVECVLGFTGLGWALGALCCLCSWTDAVLVQLQMKRQ